MHFEFGPLNDRFLTPSVKHTEQMMWLSNRLCSLYLIDYSSSVNLRNEIEIKMWFIGWIHPKYSNYNSSTPDNTSKGRFATVRRCYGSLSSFHRLWCQSVDQVPPSAQWFERWCATSGSRPESSGRTDRWAPPAPAALLAGRHEWCWLQRDKGLQRFHDAVKLAVKKNMWKKGITIVLALADGLGPGG